jgi:hypothetical protein
MTENQVEYLLKLDELLEEKRKQGYEQVDKKIKEFKEKKLKELSK